MTIKLPKLPVVKAAILSQAPVTEIIPTIAAATTADSSAKAGKSEANQSSEVVGLEDSDKRGEEQVPETPGITGAASANTSAAVAGNTTTATVPSAPSTTSSQQQTALLTTSANKTPGHLTQPYFLEQLNDVRNHTAEAICRLEDYWSIPGLAITAETASSLGASEIRDLKRALTTLLELIQRHLRAAIEAMAKPSKEKLYPFRVCDPKVTQATFAAVCCILCLVAS